MKPFWTFVRVRQKCQLHISVSCIIFSYIFTGSNNLSHRVSLLQETLLRAIQIINEVENRLEEIEIQLSVLQRQCSYRDRPLCDTLRVKGIAESGAKDKLRKVVALRLTVFF